jgi:hypothetical protein
VPRLPFHHAEPKAVLQEVKAISFGEVLAALVGGNACVDVANPSFCAKGRVPPCLARKQQTFVCWGWM